MSAFLRGKVAREKKSKKGKNNNEKKEANSSKSVMKGQRRIRRLNKESRDFL